MFNARGEHKGRFRWESQSGVEKVYKTFSWVVLNQLINESNFEKTEHEKCKH